MAFGSEEDLYAPVKAYFEAQGYEVKSEIRGCDLVARRAGEAAVIVELKTGFTLPLVLQGIDRLALSDDVYLAVAVAALPATNSLWRRQRRGILKLCRRLGLGLLAVHEASGSKPPLVVPLLDPLPYRPRPNKKRQGLLLKEFAHRVGDPNTGGVTRRPIITAYRQAALSCAAHLRKNGATKAAEVAQATAVTRAATILQRDVYGWFQRVERGIYVLSPRGEAAIETYADVLASLDESDRRDRAAGRG
ncbi:MAG: DUF2161 family putative PD-(D/E)XK-type phosphodiesterase [Chloroflexota bacterium]